MAAAEAGVARASAPAPASAHASAWWQWPRVPAVIVARPTRLLLGPHARLRCRVDRGVRFCAPFALRGFAWRGRPFACLLRFVVLRAVTPLGFAWRGRTFALRGFAGAAGCRVAGGKGASGPGLGLGLRRRWQGVVGLGRWQGQIPPLLSSPHTHGTQTARNPPLSLSTCCSGFPAPAPPHHTLSLPWHTPASTKGLTWPNAAAQALAAALLQAALVHFEVLGGSTDNLRARRCSPPPPARTRFLCQRTPTCTQPHPAAGRRWSTECKCRCAARGSKWQCSPAVLQICWSKRHKRQLLFKNWGKIG